jgi:hypothetical protein
VPALRLRSGVRADLAGEASLPPGPRDHGPFQGQSHQQSAKLHQLSGVWSLMESM